MSERLGPLLFMICMNDIVDLIESDILIFADDTSLLASGSDPAETWKEYHPGLCNGKWSLMQKGQKI